MELEGAEYTLSALFDALFEGLTFGQAHNALKFSQKFDDKERAFFWAIQGAIMLSDITKEANARFTSNDN